MEGVLYLLILKQVDQREQLQDREVHYITLEVAVVLGMSDLQPFPTTT